MTHPTDPTRAPTSLEDAAQKVLDRMFSTYRARNGRQVGVEGDDGEKVWLVHSDDIEALRSALLSSAELPSDLARGANPNSPTPVVEVDLEGLEKIARAATQGPWTVSFDSCASCGGEWDVYEIPGGAHAKFEREEDARHVATFDPPTILRLIELARSRQEPVLACYECDTPLHGPFCPACNPEMVSRSRQEGGEGVASPEPSQRGDGPHIPSSPQGEEFLEFKEALSDLRSLRQEHLDLNGGGPGWMRRWLDAWVRVDELFANEDEAAYDRQQEDAHG